MFNKEEMEYTLVRKRGQKNLRMHFNDRGELIVSCPYFTSGTQIGNFIKEKQDWIIQQKSKYINHTFTDGDFLPLWGESFELKTIEDRHNSCSEDGHFLVVKTKQNECEKNRKIVRIYYTDKLLDFAQKRAEFWADRIGKPMPQIRIVNSKSRWGVCYPQSNLIKFSLITATLPPDLIDMIVLHEVCHLIYCNHQTEFWNLMQSLMPDLKERKTRFAEISKTGIHRNLF